MKQVKNQNFNLVARRMKHVSMLLIAFALVFTSCKDEETKLGDVPTIEISRETAQNAINNEVTTTLTIKASEGAKELVILKNGVVFKTEDLEGKKEATYEFKYTVAEGLGSVVNFTFQVTDKQDRVSKTSPVFAVTVTAKPIKVIAAGNYLGVRTWSADTIYHLHGYVRIGSDVKNEDGTHTINTGNNVLNIQAGTTIIGDKESKAVLIIQRGAKLVAEGTKDKPIVFTSEQPVGLRLPGDWGGVVMCGRVKNNQGPNIELEGKYKAYHGGDVALTDVNESSGSLKYVRIEYAGVPINPNEEVNSLTMGSIGKGTKIEYVQCSYGLDDAFEWFGGSADAKYLIAYRGLDDDLDVDFGFSGNVQFALCIRDNSLADQSGSNGFEVDNNGDGSADQPFTAAAFSNITVIGPKKTRETPVNLQFQHAAQLRRQSQIKIYNSFLTGYPAGIYIDDSKGNTSQYALSDALRIRNTIIAGVDGWGGNGYGSVYDDTKEGVVAGLPFNDNKQHPNNPRGISLKQDATEGFDVVAWFNKTEYNNKRLAKWTEAGIDGSIFDLVAKPKVTPNAGSMLLTYAKWNNIPDAANFVQVPYAGAFGTEDWTEGWAEWVPQTVRYY